MSSSKINVVICDVCGRERCYILEDTYLTEWRQKQNRAKGWRCKQGKYGYDVCPQCKGSNVAKQLEANSQLGTLSKIVRT